jgi:hypothetical protein
LGDTGGRAGDAAEAQNASDDGDDEESDGPTKHGVLLISTGAEKAQFMTI